ALLARAGRSVRVLERASHLGGRAATTIERGVHFNLGPHALYVGGHAFPLLRDLGVPFTGKVPAGGDAMLLQGEQSFPLPVGLRTLLTHRLFSGSEKWKLFRLVATLGRFPTGDLQRVPLREWTRGYAGTGALARFLETLARLITYADGPAQI